MANPRDDPAARDPGGQPTTRPIRSPHGARRVDLPTSAMLLVLLGVAAMLWAVWVTRSLLTSDRSRPALAAVRLTPIVAEFVQAQARARSPETQVAADTRAFMARLDAELRRRGREGTTVLVAEAVLSRNVPDITAEVRRAAHTATPVPVRGSDAQRR